MRYILPPVFAGMATRSHSADLIRDGKYSSFISYPHGCPMDTDPTATLSPTSSLLDTHSLVSNDPVFDNPCISCGACCAHFRVSFYCGEIAGESGGTVPAELVTQISPLRGCMKGTEHGGNRCIALRGELGQPGIHCAIYEQRPSPCRDFPAWLEDGTPYPDCQRVRAMIGLPPLPRRPPDDHDLDPFNTPPHHTHIAA